MKSQMDAKIKEDLKERREYLAKALNTIKEDYTGKNYGESLRIAGPIIDSLATATAARFIRNGSSSLLLSLKIALQGIESENSQAGVIGKVLNSIIKGVVGLTIGTSLEKEDIGSQKLFEAIVQALVLATISIIWKLNQYNLAYKPGLEFDEAENQRLQVFGFELILLLILRSGIIELIVKDVAATCGAKEEKQMQIAQWIKGLVLILALLTAGKGSQLTLKTLVSDLKDYLTEGLENIQTFLNEAMEAEKTDDQAIAISIFLQQAIASLEEEDFDTLQQAYSGALEVIQANPQMMNNDIEKVVEFAKTLFQAFEQASSVELSRTTASLMI